MTGTAHIVRANALNLPLADNSVDLCVTSPPYFGLRSYQDGCQDCDGEGRAKRPDSHGIKVCPDCGNRANRKRCNHCGASMKWPPRSEQYADDRCQTCKGTGKGHYSGQIGSEATPAEFVDALIAATREMVRVLKPSGSIWVNLGDKYSGGSSAHRNTGFNLRWGNSPGRKVQERSQTQTSAVKGFPPKSLLGIPWRYALRCIDELGLILRAEVIWSKPNGLPESVTDRVRRSHEQWFHMVAQPRYFSAVDEIREEHLTVGRGSDWETRRQHSVNRPGYLRQDDVLGFDNAKASHPLGKLPGSVWTIPTQPLTVPPELGVDHFAAFPMELPRRIIHAWSPSGVCVECGEGRRPVAVQERTSREALRPAYGAGNHGTGGSTLGPRGVVATITSYACACPEPTAPTTPATVLDPFGGTGTTALVAKALGRTGISVDMSADYCRLAKWRCNDPGQLAAAMQVEKPAPVDPDQLELDFGGAA